MRVYDLARASVEIGDTRSRKAKTQYLAAALRGDPAEVGLAASWLAGVLPGGKLGVGPSTLKDLRPPPAAQAELEVKAVQAEHGALRALSGPGSTAARKRKLHQLLAQCTELEQRFLIRLWIGELRQGALESLVLDAVAAAFDLDPALVRRAQMLAADLKQVAETAARDGAAGLKRFDLELFRPIQPMLAQPADTLDEVFAQGRGWIFERKLDGARVQIHREGADVRVFSRLLNDVTEAVPEIVEAVRGLNARSLVLDGEAIALEADGRPKPFQTTMRRFGRKTQQPELQRSLPLYLFAFDLLHLDGQSLIDHPLSHRVEALALVPPELQPPRLVAPDPNAAARFVEASFEAGHEGAMAKASGSLYEAGRRGSHWLKLKQAHTVDLVVLAAEWGAGRRQGWLSNLHLGAPDGEGGFVMLGKTFKGLTDARLKAQTRDFLALEQSRQDHVVHLRPERVVEVAFSGLQHSPRYPGGIALRFARFERERPDKTPDQATPFAWFQQRLSRSGTV
jgi:DNA ligase 1